MRAVIDHEDIPVTIDRHASGPDGLLSRPLQKERAGAVELVDPSPVEIAGVDVPLRVDADAQQEAEFPVGRTV